MRETIIERENGEKNRKKTRSLFSSIMLYKIKIIYTLKKKLNTK
jgi:hypothetical protein